MRCISKFRTSLSVRAVSCFVRFCLPVLTLLSCFVVFFTGIIQYNPVPDSECAVRNLRISWMYQQISLSFKTLLGVSQAQVGNLTQSNWPSVATFASNSVGMNIRNLTLLITVQELFEGWPTWWIEMVDELGPDWIDKLPIVQRLFERMSLGLCAGNQYVFEEIGTKFSQFGIYFDGETAPNQTNWNNYAALFNQTTQQTLLEAMAHYYSAKYSSDPAEAAQYSCWANTLVGLQEQSNLQPFIVDAFPQEFNFSWNGRNVSIDVRPMATKLITLIMAQEWNWATRDIPPRPIDHQFFPVWLRDLTIPGLVQIYEELVTSQGGPQPDGDLTGTAAKDWSHLNERMRFVVPFFRSRQDDVTLDCPLFSAANTEMINAGVVPPQDQMCFANCCEVNGRGW